MLQFEKLTKQYGRQPRPAVQALDLQVRDGEILGLVGLNGAGKTTAIRLAAGISLPSSGTVLVDGRDIVREKVRAAEGLGWVSEFPNFEPQGRALELMEYYAGYHRLSGEATLRTCVGLLRQVGLGGQELAPLRSYSQGMRKRFALACALIAQPRNLLLDELLNGLDPEGIRMSRNLLIGLKREGKAILLSSHLLSEVEQMADRIAFVHKGQLLKVIPREELAQVAGSRLRVVLDDPGPGALEYLQTLGRAAQDGPVFLLEGSTTSPSEINGELVRRGFHVRDLHTETEDLETYFFRLIGGAG